MLGGRECSVQSVELLPACTGGTSGGFQWFVLPHLLAAPADPLLQKGSAVRRAMGAVGGAISSAAAAVTPARFKTSKSAAELAMGDSEGCESFLLSWFV